MTIQFNSLDVIANQETIVELLAFFKRVAPVTGSHGEAKNARNSSHHHQKRGGHVPETKEMSTQTRQGFGSIGSMESLREAGSTAPPSLMDISLGNLEQE